MSSSIFTYIVAVGVMGINISISLWHPLNQSQGRLPMDRWRLHHGHHLIVCQHNFAVQIQWIVILRACRNSI
ncbi:hypothetical protein EUGRSUZ_G01032 [Eucalyptus grandis]|uniref:Uncharacterized protein n=2 Tax=Eucalyptus grandis TaxID=71139 RepID=A0A059BB96_EUCGR|nr:hypothetical protein EUGRSUZ_G01032 [Eucalyptus grandis]